MTAAIFGLLGVIVGGLLQAVTAWRMERRREGWAARKAGRLFAHDLIRCVAFLEDLDNIGGVTWGDVSSSIASDLERWPEYGNVFAGTLDYARWQQIADAVRALEGLASLANDQGAEAAVTSGQRQYVDESVYPDVLAGAATCHSVGWLGIQREPVRRSLRRLWSRLRRKDPSDLVREAYGDEAYRRLFRRHES